MSARSTGPSAISTPSVSNSANIRASVVPMGAEGGDRNGLQVQVSDDLAVEVAPGEIDPAEPFEVR